MERGGRGRTVCDSIAYPSVTFTPHLDLIRVQSVFHPWLNSPFSCVLHSAFATTDARLGAASKGLVTGSTRLLSWASVPAWPTKKLLHSATFRLKTGWT